MIVREFEESDLAKIAALHRSSGFNYTLPDLAGKEFFSRRVVSDESGIAMAGFLQFSAQVFLVCDPRWRTPAWRMEALRQLHGACHRDAAEQGVAEVNAFLPPIISNKFGRRLKKLGWNFYEGDEWKCFSFRVT